MDWHKLQQTLYNLDPTDPREDLAKIKSNLQSNAGNAEPKKDYVSESVTVPEGSLSLDKNYSMADFAALAGINLSESKKQKDGDYARRKTMPPAKPGRTNHPDEGKLVGEAPLDSVRAGIKSAQSGAFAPDSAEKFVKNKVGGSGMPAKPTKPVAKPGTTGQVTDKVYSDFLKQHTASLKNIARDPRKKRQFDRFMASMGEAIEENVSAEKTQDKPTQKSCGKCGQNTIVNTKKGWYCSSCDKKSTTNESIKDMLYARLANRK